MVRALMATAALTALALFRLGRAAFGIMGLWKVLGPAWAVAGLAALVLLRFTLPVRIGVVLAAVYAWYLPWTAALLLAAPQVPLMLPGLIATALARLRHRRPDWRSFDGASA